MWGAAVVKKAASFSSPAIFLESQPRQGASLTHGPLRESGISSPFLAAAVDTFGRTPEFSPRNQFTSYKVEYGDTLNKIASKFGISLDTVLRANPEVKAKNLRVGMTLQIPPVSGTVYTVRENDTVESVAGLFKISPQDIRDANPLVSLASLPVSAQLIIPGYTGRVNVVTKTLPVLKGYFIMPADGFNLGQLHPQNAVDITGVCGAPVIAAAEGLVVSEGQYGNEGSGGWNGGYGKFVLLEHPAGGTRTRYAHLRSIIVGVGDYVKQGQKIGTMGDTGDASGCRVHFEVLGAVNPFVK